MKKEVEIEFVKYMCQHFVALTYECDLWNKETKDFEHHYGAAPGFIMEFHNTWWWTTAGHWFSDTFDPGITNGRIKNISFQLADYFGPEVQHPHLIPFWYEPGSAAFVHDRPLGLDFGMIFLPDLIRKGLEANHIIPITDANWLKLPDVDCEVFKILGFPVGAVDKKDGSMRPTMLNAEQISVEDAKSRMAPRELSSDAWFVACLSEGVGPIDINGMSGGPIYGFRQDEDGQCKSYHVVAVQSGWDQRSKVVVGCPITLFADMVNRIIGRAVGD